MDSELLWDFYFSMFLKFRYTFMICIGFKCKLELLVHWILLKVHLKEEFLVISYEI